MSTKNDAIELTGNAKNSNPLEQYLKIFQGFCPPPVEEEEWSEGEENSSTDDEQETPRKDRALAVGHPEVLSTTRDVSVGTKKSSLIVFTMAFLVLGGAAAVLVPGAPLNHLLEQEL